VIHQVVEFPPLFNDTHGALEEVPSINQLYDICYTLKFWLDWHPSHVALMYDSHGGTLRSAFVCAAYLRYTQRKDNVLDALAEFERLRMQRERESHPVRCLVFAFPLHFSCSLVWMPLFYQ
jgi:hypothetical protein